MYEIHVQLSLFVAVLAIAAIISTLLLSSKIRNVKLKLSIVMLLCTKGFEDKITVSKNVGKKTAILRKVVYHEER